MKIYNAILEVSRRIRQDKIFVYSSHASFYMLISAIPFITLFISLIKEFISVTEYDISKTLLPFLPVAAHNTANIVIEEIFYKTPGTLISFSVISLLWTASRGISAIRRGLRFIYGIPCPSFIFDALTAVAVLFPLIILIVLLLIAAVFITIYLSGIPKVIIGIILLTILFSLIYYIFTGRKFSFKYHIPGGISAAFSWIIFIRIYSFYIENFANYSYVYGSLTAVLLLALWIYFSIIIFFLGAELNKLLFLRPKKRTV